MISTTRFLSVASPVDTIAYGPRVDANRIEGNNGTFSFLLKNSTNPAPVNVGSLSVNGTETRQLITFITANTTLGNHYAVQCNNTTNIIVTLNSAATPAGREYVITKANSAAATITVQPSTGLIAGAASNVISTYGSGIVVWFDGTNWWIK